MSLIPGTRLGPYEIGAQLGVGGMGEVYRATDRNLGREVAIKVLPEAFAQDAERLARFEREARTLASLNHPNIAIIHGLERGAAEAGHYVQALVMELVEGPTLADLIERRGGSADPPMAIDEALPIARQIAEALEAAHEQGIVHRDLKPANIKVRDDGTVKVLDFGLAKMLGEARDFIGDRSVRLQPDLSQSPTIASPAMTRMGVILGTAAYMSPEQARGKDVDRRADIWAFGAVLYEMVTGAAPFAGETTTDILASVVKEEPDWTRVPGRIRRLVRACLQKQPKQRLQSIGDWPLLLDDADGDLASLPPRRSLRLALAGLLVASVAVALWGWLRPLRSEPRPVMRFSVDFPALSISQGPAAITHDGLRLAFATGAGGPIYLRDLQAQEAVPIRGSESGIGPSFSPDGQSIAFVVQPVGGNRQLKTMSVNGGGAVTLADMLAPGAGYSSWEADNTILYVTNNGLFRIAADGGEPQQIASIDGAKERFFGPQLLPGATHILTGIVETGEQGDFRVVAINVQSRQSTVLLERAGHARYVASRDDTYSGHIVYGRDGSLFAVPFDVRALRVGPRVSVLEGVMRVGPYVVFNISPSGTLVYTDAESRSSPQTSTLLWKDRSGKEEPIPGPPRSYVDISVSNDGARAAVAVQRPPVRLPPLLNLGIVDLARGTLTPLTSEGTASRATWSQDGQRLWFLYVPSRNPTLPEIKTMPADGSGAAETLVNFELSGTSRTSPVGVFTGRDGPLAILLRRDDSSTAAGATLLSLPLDEASRGGKARPLFAMRSQPSSIDVSPDGRLIAYQITETGRPEVWVTTFPAPGPRVLVSTDGGEAPRWNPKGRELFYRSGSRFMAADIEMAPTLRTGPPKFLFEGPEPVRGAGGGRNRSYDVSPDGQRFLLFKPEALPEQSNGVRVIVNWAEELARKAPRQK